MIDPLIAWTVESRRRRIWITVFSSYRILGCFIRCCCFCFSCGRRYCWFRFFCFLSFALTDDISFLLRFFSFRWLLCVRCLRDFHTRIALFDAIAFAVPANQYVAIWTCQEASYGAAYWASPAYLFRVHTCVHRINSRKRTKKRSNA